MPIYCLACPNKGPLKRNWCKCANCESYYHSSCADRIGYVSAGIVKKCCRNYIPPTSPDSSATFESFSSSSPLNSTSLDLNLQLKDNNTDISIMGNDPLEKLWQKIKNELDNGISKKLDNFIQKCDDQFQLIHNRMDEYDTQLSNMQNEVIEAAVNELDLRISKKRYVIFKNIPDNNNDEDDLQFITGLLDPSKIKVDLDLNSITTFRLGGYDDNQSLPRLLKVRFSDPDDAQYVIYNNKSFHFPDNITCNSDKTYMQRNMIKNAVIELKNRESRGEKNLTIQYIHKVPKVVHASSSQSTSLPHNSKAKSKPMSKNKSNFQSTQSKTKK